MRLSVLSDHLHEIRFGATTPAVSFCSSNTPKAILDLVSGVHNFRVSPFIHWLEQEAGLSTEDSWEVQLDKLEDFLRPNAEELVTEAQLLAGLLSLPTEERYGAAEPSPERRRARTFATLTGQLLRRSSRAPLLLVFEDVHWIDPTSEELLGEVLAGSKAAPILILITHRPHYVAPWGGYPHVSTLALNRLSRGQSIDLVRSVGGRGLSGEVIEQIIGRADGVPLFVEELAKAVLEVGDAASEIPATLRASLTARLDRLGDAKEVAQIGAAIGREYTLDVVRATGTKMGLAVDDLHQELVDSELVFPTISSQGAAYAFGHALVQEAAYETMLKSRRAILHRQIAEVLEAEFPSVVEARPETLARHFTEGAVSTSAIMYRRRAGEMCAGTLANVEAAHHFQQALELLLKQPAAAERDAEELQLRVASGGPLLMTKGHGSSEVEAAYTSALELSESLGDTSHLTPSLFGLWRHAVGRGDCNISGDLGQQLLELSDRSGNLPGQVLGHYGLGYTLFCRGSLEESLAHLEAGAELYALSLRTP